MNFGHQISVCHPLFTSWVAKSATFCRLLLIFDIHARRRKSGFCLTTLMDQFWKRFTFSHKVCSYFKTCLVRHSDIRGTIYMLANETCSVSLLQISYYIENINYWLIQEGSLKMHLNSSTAAKKRSVAGEEFDKPFCRTSLLKGTESDDYRTDQLCLICA